MAVIGRVLEAQGFRVGIIAQPDWQSAEPFKALGKPNLFFGVDRRQHGFDDQPLHGRSQDPQRRCLHAGRRRRQAPRPRLAGLRAALQGGLQRRADRASAASRPACAASRTTTTGRTRCGARSWSTARPTCCCTATPSARSSRSRTGWPGASRSGTSPTCAARPSWCAARRAGLLRDRLDRGRPARAHRRPHQPVPDDQRGGGLARPDLREGRGHCNCGRGRRGRDAGVAQDRRGADAAAREDGDPPAGLRAGQERHRALCACQPRAAPGDQPRQCAGAGAAARPSATCGSTRRRSR